MTRILCLSSSLHRASRSRALLRRVHDGLATADGVDPDWLDLAENDLPLCDGRPLEAYGPTAVAVSERIDAADALVFGMAVYCYSISGALKNVIDLCARGMDDKPFGVVAASGGKMSYMAVGALQSILAFESRCRPFPRVVFAAGSDWSGDGPRDEGLLDPLPERIDQFVADFVPFAGALATASPG